MFLAHLATERRVSASTQSQACSALLFLYGEVLGRPLDDLGPVVRAKGPARLPVVLTRGEVSEVLQHLSGVCGLMAALMYRSGLRLIPGVARAPGRGNDESVYARAESWCTWGDESAGRVMVTGD